MDRGSGWNAAHYILAILVLAVAFPCWSQESIPDDGGQRNRVVLVSLVDRKLAVIDNGVVIATFQVAVGAQVSPSPTGEFKIVSRVSNPTYYHHGTVIPTGKDNPVGTRWVGLNLKGYGIHGTNAPGSIGSRGFAWMHSPAEPRCGASVHDASGGRCGSDSRRTRRGNRSDFWRRGGPDSCGQCGERASHRGTTRRDAEQFWTR